MENIVTGTTGVIHLISAILAMITGLYVLINTKGTRTHKRMGYIYSLAMIILNITSFMIYRLYGKFGIFHWFSVISCLTLFVGLFPILTKRPKNYLIIHFNFMYWSVVGLYCAFMAEIFSRLPKIILTETGEPTTGFYKGVGIGIAIVMTIGVLYFIKYQPIWTKKYEEK